MKNLTVLLLVSLLGVSCSKDDDHKELEKIEILESLDVSEVDGRSCFNDLEANDYQVDAYTMDFQQPIELWTNKRGKFTSKLSVGRRYGCYLFSLEKNLSGKYYSGEALQLKLRTSAELAKFTSLKKSEYDQCLQKRTYKMVQFYSDAAKTKKVFRLQCDYAAYEDNKPEAFAPAVEVLLPKDFDSDGKIDELGIQMSNQELYGENLVVIEKLPAVRKKTQRHLTFRKGPRAY